MESWKPPPPSSPVFFWQKAPVRVRPEKRKRSGLAGSVREIVNAKTKRLLQLLDLPRALLRLLTAKAAENAWMSAGDR